MGIFGKLFNKEKEKKSEISTQEKSIIQKVNVYGSQNDLDPILKRKLNCDLYPGEVYLIWWADGRSAKYELPRYFSYEFGINTDNSLKRLLQKNLLSYASPYASLKNLKVQELKSILIEQGLNNKGIKSELIQEIIKNIPENIVGKYINEPVYAVTPEGNDILTEYSYIIYGHNQGTHDGCVNVVSMMKYHDKLPKYLKNEDITWRILNDAFNEHSIKRKYGMLRNVICSQAEFLKKEKRFLDSLSDWILALTLDLSGLGNAPTVIDSGKETYPYRGATCADVMVIPYIFDEINEIIKNENFEMGEYNLAYEHAWKIYSGFFDRGLLDKLMNYEVIKIGLSGSLSSIQKFYKDDIYIKQ